MAGLALPGVDPHPEQGGPGAGRVTGNASNWQDRVRYDDRKERTGCSGCRDTGERQQGAASLHGLTFVNHETGSHRISNNINVLTPVARVQPG